jgi:hypothetical protein
MFEAGWIRKEKRMVQETTRDDMFNQGKVEPVWSRRVNRS